MVDEDTIRSACSSLLRRVGGNRLEIAHFTVQKYLQNIDAGDLKIGIFKINEMKANAALAGACLTYLCLPDFDKHPPATLQESDAQNGLYPIFQHAARSWVDYAIRNSWQDEKVLCLSRRLFTPKKTYNFIAFCLEYVVYSPDGSTTPESSWRGFVDKIASGGLRPLHIASMMHLSTMCQYLIDEGSDVNQESGLGTPLKFAINDDFTLFWPKSDNIPRYKVDYRGLYDTITVLIAAGATCQLHNSERNYLLSLLILSADPGESKIFRYLLESGMQIRSDLLSWLQLKDRETNERFF